MQMSFDWQVTGVVGRAELLSSIFYLWTLMVYAKCIGKSQPIGTLFVWHQYLSGSLHHQFIIFIILFIDNMYMSTKYYTLCLKNDTSLFFI